MSQTPLVCTACGTSMEPGTRFCQNCGAPAAAPVAPTAMSSPPNSGSQVPSNQGGYSSPSNPGYPPAPSNPGYPSAPSNPGYPPAPSNPGYPPAPSNPGYPPVPSNPPVHTNYNSTPPPPNYNVSSATGPSDPYGTPPPAPGTYPNVAYPATPKKKRSPWPAIIIGIVVGVILLCSGTSWALVKLGESATKNTTNSLNGLNGNNGVNNNDSGNYPASSVLDLTTVYASDQINFTSIEQASKFSDDPLSTYSLSKTPNFVRINFKEQQLAKHGSYFGYTSTFHLILPNKDVVSSEKAQQYTGPDQGVVRSNWIDFPTNGKVDLTKLTLRLGSGEEAQMEIPLKTGADISKYKPKVTTLNKQFDYAGMKWTVKDVTQSYYSDGYQAKTGQIYLIANLVADNATTSEVYLTGDAFCRLKVDGSVLSPEYSSDTTNFDIIKPNTTNITGSLTFLTKVSSTGSYTLDFQAGDNIQQQTVDFSIS